jgi:hypothetical protein
MAAASALAGRGRRSGRSGIAAKPLLERRARVCVRWPAAAIHGAERTFGILTMFAKCPMNGLQQVVAASALTVPVEAVRSFKSGFRARQSKFR